MGLNEEEVGITEYLNKTNPGFFGVLKHRYSDFMVNEIDPQGNVVWLKTSNDKVVLPKKVSPQDQLDNLNEESVEEILKNDFSILSEEDLALFKNYLMKIIMK